MDNVNLHYSSGFRFFQSAIVFAFGLLLLLSGNKTLYAQDVGLEWVKGIGGSSSDMGLGLAVDDSGNVYTTGYFKEKVDFGTGSNAVTLTALGSEDIFVCKQNAEGNFVWAKSMGGTSTEWGRFVAVDDSGNVYTTGYFKDTVDFDPGAGSHKLGSGGNNDVFVSKLDARGNFVWATRLGGSGAEEGYGIAVDHSGNTYITGYFQGVAQFGSVSLTALGNTDIFIAKLNAAGNVAWAKSMGAAGGRIGHQGLAIAIDSSGNVYGTGYFMQTVDFDPGTKTANLTSNGDQDIFVVKLNGNGDFVWAKGIGGSGADYGQGITIDHAGDICVTGYFSDQVDFNPDPTKTLYLNSNGTLDIFIAKLKANGDLIWAKGIGGPNLDEGEDIITDTLNNVYVTGWFRGNIDFDPGPNSTYLNSDVTQNMFILKLDAAGDFAWAKTMRGYGPIGASLASTTGLGIGVAPSGAVYTTGYFQGVVDFDPGPDSFKLTAGGLLPDIFVHKMSCTDTSSSVLDETTCDTAYVLNGISYTGSGTYIQKIPNAAGCDSTITLHLTLHTIIPAAITVNGFKLGTGVSYSSYQWLLNNNPIPGATDSVYTVTQNGDYAVMVTNEYGCTDTGYYKVTNYTGIATVNDWEQAVKVYPNPAQGKVYIQAPVPVTVSISSMEGRLLLQQDNAQEIDVSNLSSGVYILNITGGEGKRQVKTLKLTKLK